MRLLKGLTAAILLLSPGLCRAGEVSATAISTDTATVSAPVAVKSADKPQAVTVRDTVYVPVLPASLDSLTRVMEQRLKAIEERMYGIDTIRNVISSPLQERNEQHRAKRYAERESARANNWMRGRSHPFDRGIDQIVFVPKGQWLVGGNISFQDYTEDNYKFLIVEDINLDAYMFKVSPFIGYFVADNTALGARLVYSRTSADVGSVNLKINDDLSFGINDLTYIQHQYDVSLFLRNYINLGTQRRIGLFNETRLTYGGGQGKLVNSSKEEVKGTYQKIRSLQLGLAPGIVAFVTDNVGVEVSVGVLGLKYNTINQVTNQVETGKHSRTSANFKIDLFSINLGMAFYINSMRGLNPVNYKFRKSARQATEDDFGEGDKNQYGKAMRQAYGYITLVTIVAAMLSLGGCIVNDIPYPNRQPSFKAFEVEGQIGVSEFDNVKRTVSLTVDGEHDITDVRVIYYEISDSTEMVPEMPESLNLSRPYRCTLRTWQDYEWTIDAKWDVNYIVNVENQVGNASIDTVNRVAIVTVAKSQPLTSVRIDKMELGPANAVITPDPYERKYDLLGDGTVFEVSMFGRTEQWRVSAQHANFTISGKTLVAWTKTATATADVPVGSNQEMGYEYRRDVDEGWSKTDIGNVSLEGGTMTAVMTDLEPGTKYVCRPFLGDERGQEQTFTTDDVVDIPNMSFEEWFNKRKNNHDCWFPYAEGGAPYWATGNDGIAMVSDGATYPVTDKVKEGRYAAYMETKKVTIGVPLAAGNLFTGDFITNVSDPGSSPKFGRPFTGRPAKLSGWYIYQPGIIDVYHQNKFPEDSQHVGETDKCHVYIYLENWRGATARPKEADRDIVAYGEFKTDASTTDYQQFVINLEYRTTTIKPTHIVLVATSSVYGERYCGATGSKLWIDALSFDYDTAPIVKK